MDKQNADEQELRDSLSTKEFAKWSAEDNKHATDVLLHSAVTTKRHTVNCLDDAEESAIEPCQLSESDAQVVLLQPARQIFQ